MNEGWVLFQGREGAQSMIRFVKEDGTEFLEEKFRQGPTKRWRTFRSRFSSTLAEFRRIRSSEGWVEVDSFPQSTLGLFKVEMTEERPTIDF